jgi:hypothetical protein
VESITGHTGPSLYTGGDRSIYRDDPFVDEGDEFDEDEDDNEDDDWDEDEDENGDEIEDED